MKLKYITIITLLLLSSCDKFLEVEPKGIVMPTKLADYEGLLYSRSIIESFSGELRWMTDDVYFFMQTSDVTTRGNSYLWREYIDSESQNSPAIWGSLYNTIYNANAIINGVLQVADGTEAQRRQIYSEAMVIRSYCYLELLTVFAKAYNPGSASQDPGLPMVTSTDVGQKIPARSSIKSVIDAISADLTTAAVALPANNVNKYRVTKFVAYALLSRIGLYKGDFAAAKSYAEQVLAVPHTSVDYNNYTAATLPKAVASPEVLFMRAGKVSGNVSLYSEDLMKLFDEQYPSRPFTQSPDLRFRYTTTGTVDPQRSTTNETENLGITFAEMDLTVAEVLARDGQTVAAMAIVNALRKNRILASSYSEQVAVNPEDALTKVLAERRRELALGAMRWFDMKRLDAEGRMPEVKRVNRPQGSLPRQDIGSLPPRSERYTFQIPLRVLLSNPHMQKN